MTDETAILGWDVGGTKCAAVVALARGRVVERVDWPANAPAGPEAMLGDFLGHVRPMLERREGIEELGVSIGGPMNPWTGVILSPPHLPGWDEVPLAEILTRELGLAVTVEHDAVACLLAEWLWGAAAGTTHAAYLTCGTGCGAGIMTDTRIVRGPGGQTPEVGHVRMADDGPQAFGKPGCVESFSSGEGIARLATYLFPQEFPQPVDTQTLHRHSETGHAAARAVLEESARRTGQLCGMLVDIFSPQRIVLGSLARYFAPWWIEQIDRHCRRESLPLNVADTKIVPAGLGADLQDLSTIAPCVFRARHEPRRAP